MKQNKTRGRSISRTLRDDANAFFGAYQNDVTRKAYIINYAKFIEFCRSEFNCRTKSECGEHIQEYAEKMIEKGFSASTIHTYIAPVCIYHGVSMSKIEKPIRHTADYLKSRSSNGKAERSDNNINNPIYQKTIEFQRRVGIRRNELRRLCGSDLVRDESGYLCVRVRRGKGGKMQLQRILPEDEEFVSEYFNISENNEKLFMPKELENKLDYHHLRAENAQRCYEYYKNRLDNEPDFREVLTTEIKERWQRYNINKKTGKPKTFPDRMIQGQYRLRGKNKKLAKELGKPIEYDKLAVLAVSIFHLAHWRNDVTVQSYLLSA